MRRSARGMAVAGFGLAALGMGAQPSFAFGQHPPAEASAFCAAGNDYHFASHGDCVMAVNNMSSGGTATASCVDWQGYVDSLGYAIFANYADCIVFYNQAKTG
jgi:hypothetical protein